MSSLHKIYIKNINIQQMFYFKTYFNSIFLFHIFLNHSSPFPPSSRVSYTVLSLFLLWHLQSTRVLLYNLSLLCITYIFVCQFTNMYYLLIPHLKSRYLYFTFPIFSSPKVFCKKTKINQSIKNILLIYFDCTYVQRPQR